MVPLKAVAKRATQVGNNLGQVWPGLSQRKMAVMLGVDPAKSMGWGAERHQATGKSLDLIARVVQTRQGRQVGQVRDAKGGSFIERSVGSARSCCAQCAECNGNASFVT
jgi:hypothetical protein